MTPNIAPMATAPAKPATICAGLSICGGAQLGVTRTQQVAPMWIRSTSEMETWTVKRSETSAFGGIIALNQSLDAQTAREITQIFTEVVIAPGADDAAREIFAAKKNLRLLITPGLADPRQVSTTIRQISGGYLLQDKDTGHITADDLEIVTKKQPTAAQLADMMFAWTVAKHVKSNAVIYVKDGATVGVGAGQMSRVDSSHIAARKAEEMSQALGLSAPLTQGSVVASDAFFPFADGLLSAVACVDSQASSFVVPSVDYLLRVTDAKPSFTIATANGDTNPVAIGVAGVHLQDESGRWHYFEVDGVIVLPQCDRVLYSWPTMARAGVKHMLDDNYLLMPNGGRVPVSAGLTVEASFGPPPAISAHPATIGSGRSFDHEGDPVRGASSAPSKTGRGSDSAASVPQSLLWQRLGFPSEHAWRHSREVIIDHGLPSSTSLRFDFGVVDAVARARTRSLPFHKLRDPSEVPAPGAVLYLDYAGPLTASYPHKFEYYCGVVDAGSGFSRLFACHGPTKEVAKRAMETLLADISALMGLTHALKPQVVVTDQGSAFMSKYFSDFLADSQVRHWPSTAYTPQQNAYVERMWGTRFSMARALLAHANLGPSWHPWALQTANWILNRLPQPSRGNLSSYFILSRAPASVAYLRTFGCLVRVLVPLARRDGDRHFADRGRLGICLGPSEACPGACVYIPSTRTFVVSREVMFYEDTLPGVKGVDAAWRDVHASPGDEGAGGGALPTPSGFVSPSLPHVPPHPSPPPPAPTVAPAPAPAAPRSRRHPGA